MARKSDVKLLRSPRTRVFGSHNSAISSERLLKLLRREMLNKPRITTNKKKNKKTNVRWNRIERGCLIVADRQVGVSVCKGLLNIMSGLKRGNQIHEIFARKQLY
jgi:hypothetical protein